MSLMKTHLANVGAWSNRDHRLWRNTLQRYLKRRILEQIAKKFCSIEDQYIIIDLNYDSFTFPSLEIFLYMNILY